MDGIDQADIYDTWALAERLTFSLKEVEVVSFEVSGR